MSPGAGVCPWDGTPCVEVAPADLALVGQSVEGGFEVVRILGAGGSGLVFEARQPWSDRAAALKVLRLERTRDPRTVRRFLQEVAVLSRMSGRSTAPIIGTGHLPDGRMFVAAERFEGASLRRVLLAETRLPPERAVRLATRALDALAEAHALGVLHRDMKPENLFVVKILDDSEDLRVLDFGLAKLRGEPSPLTGSGFVCGTPAYMSPEQALGRNVDARSDLYALGAVLFEMLAGVLPFEQHNPVRLLEDKVSRAAPDVREAAPGIEVSPALAAAVASLLALRPRDRPESAGVARVLLARAMGWPEPAPAWGERLGSFPAPGEAGPPPRARTMTTWAWWLLALLAGAAIGVLVSRGA